MGVGWDFSASCWQQRSLGVGEEDNEKERVHDNPGRLETDAHDIELHDELQEQRECRDRQAKPSTESAPLTNEVAGDAIRECYDQHDQRKERAGDRKPVPRKHRRH